MSGFTVKKDSWHYKWLSFYSITRDIWNDYADEDLEGNINVVENYSSSHYYFNRPRDFCSYWRRVLVWPAFRILLSNIPVFLLIFMITTTGLQYAGLGFGMFLLMLLCIAAIGIGIALVIKGFKKGTDVVINSVAETEFVEAAYRSYKDNICIILDYEEDIK